DDSADLARNADGDLLVLTTADNRARVILRQYDARSQEVAHFEVASDALLLDAQLVDIDGDGTPDLTEVLSTAITVRLRASPTALGPPVRTSHVVEVASVGRRSALYADFDRDGELDVLLHEGALFSGDGSGRFPRMKRIPSVIWGSQADAGDLNG